MNAEARIKDPRVANAAAHWGPRFTVNGVDFSDFKDVTSSLQSWDVSVDGSQPFWIVRLFAGLGIIFGQLCFFFNIYRTYRMGPRPELEAAMAPVFVRTKDGQPTAVRAPEA